MKRILTSVPLLVMSCFLIAQNVGIGTTNPIFRLDVRNGSINTDSVYRINNFTVLSTAGSQNLFIGRNSGPLNTGVFNTFGGINAGASNISGIDNTFFGANAGVFNSTGSSNSFFGAFAGDNTSTGDHNAFFGKSAGGSNTASFNTFFGSQAGVQSFTGQNNCFFGYAAGNESRTAYSNVAIGSNALRDNVFTGNLVAVGDSAMLLNISGRQNVAVGSKAMLENREGERNTAVGYEAAQNNSFNSNNTAIGYRALGDNNGARNTAIGANASYFGGVFGFTGYHTTSVGYQAGTTNTSATNATAIGAFALATDNQVRLGNADVTSIGGVVGWSNFSDGRFKQNIQENVPGLDFILQLRPITYELRTGDIDSHLRQNLPPRESIETKSQSKQIIRYSGFVAQDVESIARKLNFDFSGIDAPKNKSDLYSLRYAEFVVPLVKAMQEQQALIISQQQQIDELKTIVTALKNKLH